MRYQFVDCRWELSDPEAGRRAYLDGHIPGASFLDVDRDLSAPPGERGRHPLPSAEDFAGAAGHAGIGDGVFVVAYGSLGGADRLWWRFRKASSSPTAAQGSRPVSCCTVSTSPVARASSIRVRGASGSSATTCRANAASARPLPLT